MKTPITDAVYPPDIIDREFKAQGRTYGWGTLHDMRDVARRLELDRAALIEALTNLERRATFGTVSEEYIKESRRALSAARANFPTE